MIRLLSLSVLSVFLCVTVAFAQKDKKKTKEEKVVKICDGLAFADKPILAIMPFKIGAPGAAQEVGTGLPDMLMNALFNSGCFRVVERDRLADIMKEQGMGLSGAGDEASFAQVGKMAGAQILVMGTITEFKENESGGGAAGGSLLRRSPLGAVVGGIGSRTSHLGYTLKFVSPTTGEVLDMKSFDKKKTATGVAAGGIFGATAGGGMFYSSKSMQDALEESLIEAVTYMSQNKETYLGAASEAKAAAAAAAGPKVSKEDCALLSIARKPKIMVIIPEEHLAGAGSAYDDKRVRIEIEKKDDQSSNSGSSVGDQDNARNQGTDAINDVRRMFRPPDPAGETEVIKRFLQFGFEVVDPKQLEKLRTEAAYQNAFESPAMASQIASKFGADIIIVGEAFSEYSKAQNGMSSCRARVEVKGIMAKNAKILVTEGLHGSGMDVSEVIAGKTALRNAGGKIADYFLAELCAKADAIAADMGKPGSSGKAVAAVNASQITFTNVDFTKATALSKMIQAITGVSKAERVSFAENTALFDVSHTGDLNTLIEKMVANKAGLKLDVKSLNGNTALIAMK